MNKTEQLNKLNNKQSAFLSNLLTSKSIIEACKRTKISRTTYYSWLKEESFRSQLIKQRKELINESFEALKGALIKAVDNLIELMDDPNPMVKRSSCKDIIDYSFKAIEIQDIEERLARLEEYSKTKIK